jgi:hypothetical protein
LRQLTDELARCSLIFFCVVNDDCSTRILSLHWKVQAMTVVNVDRKLGTGSRELRWWTRTLVWPLCVTNMLLVGVIVFAPIGSKDIATANLSSVSPQRCPDNLSKNAAPVHQEMKVTGSLVTHGPPSVADAQMFRSDNLVSPSLRGKTSKGRHKMAISAIPCGE